MASVCSLQCRELPATSPKTYNFIVVIEIEVAPLQHILHHLVLVLLLHLYHRHHHHSGGE